MKNITAVYTDANGETKTIKARNVKAIATIEPLAAKAWQELIEAEKAFGSAHEVTRRRRAKWGAIMDAAEAVAGAPLYVDGGSLELMTF